MKPICIVAVCAAASCSSQGDRFPERVAIKVISKLHTAETAYLDRHKRYSGSLEELGVPSELNGFRFELMLTLEGYAIRAMPIESIRNPNHTFYSDQTLAIHQHLGTDPAGPKDPLIGERPNPKSPAP